MLQCPSQLDFDTTFLMNMIKGCDVTLDNAQIMWKIWGPLVIKMKEKKYATNNVKEIV